MFRNFFITAIRNFRRNGFYTLINTGGLAMGFATVFFIVLYVSDEMSYDRFHNNAERIYRICANGVFGDTEVHQTHTSAPLPAALINDYPEVEKTVRIQEYNNVEVRYGDIVFNEDKFLMADSSFFEIFSFPVLLGDSKTALTGNNGILLSETTARKYFGNEDALGRILRMNNQYELEVKGIFRDIPDQSHFHFDFVGSLSALNPDRSQNWMNNNYITYLLLREGADPKILESKFPEMIRKYIWTGDGEWEKFREAGNNWEYFLQPLTEIHLTSDLNGEFEANGRKEYVYIFLFSAILVLVIAAVNFTNLTTARSEKRAREVGIRKVLGSSRRTLIRQFLFESILTAIIALFMAFLIVFILLNKFNEISGKSFEWTALTTPVVLSGAFLIAICVGIISGIYPSFVLSSYLPATIMKTGRGSAKGNSRFRGLLVIFQFFISTSLLIGTMIIYSQLRFFQKSNLGFDKEKVVIVQGADKLAGQFPVFRDKMLKDSHITHVSGTGWAPGGNFNNWGVTPEGWDNNNFTTLNMIICDTAFLKTMGMGMAGGRFFSPEFRSDTAAIIINEEAVKILGWDQPVGKKILIWGRLPFEVIGVIKDFHYESMHSTVRPMGIIQYPFYPSGWLYPSLAAVKINGTDPHQTIKFIQDQWDELANGIPFRYTFADEEYQNLYNNEINTGNVFFVFSILAVLIASLGLFALSSYTIEQRTREIGIRKVNGANPGDIVLLLTGEFTRWVFIAVIFAIPVGYFMMNKWLENFAYKTELSIWIFAAASLAGFVIAGLTISLQTIRASRQNPAKSLRYE